MGRAGRDGLPARGLLVFSEASVRLQEFFIDLAHPDPRLVAQVLASIVNLTLSGETPDVGDVEFGFDRREERIKVSSAVNRLIGMDLVRRQGADGRLYPVTDAGDRLGEALDPDEWARRRENDVRKLQRVSGYARRRRCRRNTRSSSTSKPSTTDNPVGGATHARNERKPAALSRSTNASSFKNS